VWEIDIQISIKKTLILSVLFHAGLLVLLLAVALNRSTRPFVPQVYRVDLVTLPSAPTTTPPPVQKPPAKAKVKEAGQPTKVEIKKPPVPPRMKPVAPVAAISPSMKTRETAPSKAPASQEHSAVAAIPSPAAKVEAGIEVPDFKYPYYLDLIQRKIEMHWSPPPLESTSEIKETVVGFILSATGKIENPKIEKSSGNAFFDQAALRAVYQANPLPPFPQGIRDPSLKVHFNFSLMKKS
jgi:TonB family protein